ncbi:BREX-1 system adenine-specific DNA-methyltransferase PglX [Burkholderia gladioli]|uniref:BREX-1 system adenine-specific DNA-methyltransferase PglX n=1 Tax=Burkholderia gladioli TaxID=28095 RepID=UPI0038B3694D
MNAPQNRSGEQFKDNLVFRVSAVDIKKIPGSPIAYWASAAVFRLFSEGRKITDFVNSRDGLTTGNNEAFIRYHFEVDRSCIDFDSANSAQFWMSMKRFAPLIKGGPYRKWYGNLLNVITYDKSSFEILSGSGNKLPSREFYFRENLNWTRISSPAGSFRYTSKGCIFESASLCAYSKDKDNLSFALAAANSCIATPQLNLVNPTTNLLSGYFDMLRLPEAALKYVSKISSTTNYLVAETKSDWDSSEISWDFTSLPLLRLDFRQPTLKACYQKLRTHWREMTLEMQRREEENNRIFIDAYGLQDELTPEVPLKEITLTCNPHYRYGGDKSEEELEALLLADTMRELVSYAVGCMFGRYSLDKPGLILANQGDTLADYLAQVPQPRFPADDDNVIPLLDGDWFADDITLRVRQFLRVAFGDTHYEDNLAFIEQALNIKGKRNYGLRDYLLGEFYADHVKRYKKRPIYWLFSSPKSSFNALIYMHRYRPDTVSVVLRYLRDYREKLATEKERQAAISINPASSQGDKTRALKETERLGKVLAELEGYERNVLYPLATQQVQIDLDNGVKVSYLKFEGALKKITGLAAKDED